MKHFILFCITFLVLNGCVRLTPADQQLRYIDAYTSYKPEYIDHIPKRQPVLLNTYSYSNPLHPNNTRIAYFVVSEEIITRRNYLNIKNEIINSSIIVCSSNDNCFTLLNASPSVSEVYQQDDSSRFIPVPSQVVYKESFRTTEVQRLETSDIYILELEKGTYLEGDRSDSTIRFPSGWEQGISKGISFNDEKNYITYWTLLW